MEEAISLLRSTALGRPLWGDSSLSRPAETGPDRVKTRRVMDSGIWIVLAAPRGPMGAWRVDPSHSTGLGEVWLRDAVRRVQRAANGVSGLHCCYQHTIAQQVERPFEVVGEDMQAHFRTHSVERPGKEMGGANPGLLNRLWFRRGLQTSKSSFRNFRLWPSLALGIRRSSAISS